MTAASRVIAVTGGASGIGFAFSEALARAGHQVVIADLRGAVEAAERLSAQGLKAIGTQTDVVKPADVAGMVEQAVKAFGRLDVLVNNAGVNTIANRVPVDEFPRAEWDRILGVDLTGLYEMSKAAAAVMRRQQSGRIINIASIAGLVPLRLQCAFVAAKAGVVNLTRAMALELGPVGVLVNGIAPGSTLTEGTRKLFYGDDGLFKESVRRMLDHVPLDRPGTVDEIAVAALFLADPENSYMTGHTLVVDGGWTAGYARDF